MNTNYHWILKALLSHYWRHPGQTLFLALGLVVGVGLWSAVQIINQHAESSYQDAQRLLGAQANYWIRDRDGEGIDQAVYIKLRRAGFRQVFPLVEFEVGTDNNTLISIIATDIIALPADGNVVSNDMDFAEDWLEFIQPPYRAWYSPVLANELGISEGEQLRLRDGRLLPPALLQTQSQQGRRVFMDIGAALDIHGTDSFSYLAVGPLDINEAERLRRMLPQQLKLVENQQHIDLQSLTDSLHTHLSAMSLLSFAVGLFIVFNAVRFSLWYRRATLLNLRLLGCSAKQLTAAILFETLLWSLIGTALGFGLGILFAYVLLPDLGSSLQNLYNASIEAELALNSLTLLKAWCITFLGLLLALGWPLYRQISYSVLESARTENRLQDEASARRRLALAGALLAVLGVIGYTQIDTVIGGFVVLGFILFAAAWLLPITLATGLRFIAWCSRDNNLLARWQIADGWFQLPVYRSAMMALLLALTANLGVGTLVDSFRDAFINWLEQIQSADVYASSTKLSEQELIRIPGNEQWLTDVHQRISVTTRWLDRPALVRGIEPTAQDTQALPLSRWQGASEADALQAWRTQSNTVLINEQAHFLGHVNIGDDIALQTDRGVHNFRVVGVFYDYGNPYFQIYMPSKTLMQFWQHYNSLGFAFWLNQDNPRSLEQAENALRALGLQPGDWITRQEVRELSVGIFDRTFAITAAMNGLTMSVAAMALLASLLAILQERLPQFAQWRALGLRQYEQLLLIAVPLVIFCGIVWLFSIPLGALLSWVLIHKLNIISFGWSMPLQWEFTPALYMGLLVAAICLLTITLVSFQWRRNMPRALRELGEEL